MDSTQPVAAAWVIVTHAGAMDALRTANPASSSPPHCKENTVSQWIDRSNTLQDALATAPTLIGLDTEFMRTNTFHPKLALVQLSLDGNIALVDPTADLQLDPLDELLGNGQHVIVLHSGSEDLEALATRMPSRIGTLFDTQIAAAFAGLGSGLGYQRLVDETLGVQLDKGETRSDWMRRPLSDKQLHYAAQDVVHLLQLHELLSEKLEQRGFTAWHHEDCQMMVARAFNRGADPQPHLALRGAARWPLEKQALLRRLLLWRERAAREHDKPRSWILDDARALNLADDPPANSADLFERVRGLRALRGSLRTDLLTLLQQPLQPEELDIPAIAPPPGPQEQGALSALREVVAAHARKLDLPASLLASRRHLESLLSTGQWPSALDGWRRELLHDELVELLPGPAATR